MKVIARMCPGPLPRRCIRRMTSQSRTRHWTTSPMPACCTSTVRSMRERNAGSMRGSSDSASSVPHRKLKAYKLGFTNGPARTSRWAGTRSFRTSQSSTSVTPELTCWPRATWANRPRGESFPWAVQLSATTSPVSVSAFMASSAGTSLTPLAERLCARGSMEHQRSASGQYTDGPFPFRAVSWATASPTISRSTGPCSRTANPWARSPSSAWRTFGLAVRHGSFVGFFGKTYFTKTFDTERRRPEFGTLSLSWYF